MPSESDLCVFLAVSGVLPVAVEIRYGSHERTAPDSGWARIARTRPSWLQDGVFRRYPSRDAADHQGTVWAWLIGPFIDAWLKLHPGDHERAMKFLEGFTAHLTQAGIETISEVFDAESSFTPRGCIAQAWSVAEVLRCRMRAELNEQVGKAKHTPPARDMTAENRVISQKRK